MNGRHKRLRIGGGAAVLGALATLLIVGLSAGLIASSVLWSQSVASLQSQINNITTGGGGGGGNSSQINELIQQITDLTTQVNGMSTGIVPLPCYNGQNQPSVPLQIQCLCNDNRPDCNCDFTYQQIGSAFYGNSLCGILTFTKINGVTSVLLGFGGELMFASNANNSNPSYKPELPFFNSSAPFNQVLMSYRFPNYIPPAWRPTSVVSGIGSAYLGFAPLMTSSINGYLLWPNGTLDQFVSFGDTVPDPSIQRIGWTFTAQFGFWILGQ